MGSHLVLRVQAAPDSEWSNKQFTKMQPIFVFMFFTLASSAPLLKDQTPSWVNICGGTYLFSEDLKSWDDAYGQCELYDAHLWQIDNLAENFCLLDYSHTMEFGGRQTEHCCPGLLGGTYQKTVQGNQMEERPRTVVLFISMITLGLVSGGMAPARMRISMFV